MSGTNETWEYQGRQEHGWFGHGTAPGDLMAADGRPTGPGDVNAAADAIWKAALAVVGKRQPGQVGLLRAANAGDRLQALLKRWSKAAALSEDAFARHFFDPFTDRGITENMQEAAVEAAAARNGADIQRAGKRVAAATMAVGAGQWSRFLSGAERRAAAGSAGAAVSSAVPLPPIAAPGRLVAANAARPGISTAGRMLLPPVVARSPDEMHVLTDANPDPVLPGRQYAQVDPLEGAEAGAAVAEARVLYKALQAEIAEIDAVDAELGMSDLTRAQKTALTRAENVIRENAKETDFTGVARERAGFGFGFDHITEMRQSVAALNKSIETLEGSLKNPYLGFSRSTIE